LAIPLFGTDAGFAFALLAIYVALVAFLTAALNLKTRTYPAHALSSDLLTFIRSAPILTAIVIAFGFADIAAISAMPIYFVRLGYAEGFAAVTVTTMALPAALAQPLVGLLLDRFDRATIVICFGLVAALSYLALPLIASPMAILAVFATMGIAAFALYTCSITMLGETYSGSLLVSGSAVFALAYAVGSAVGSSALGFVIEVVPTAAPLVAGFVLLGFNGIFLFGFRKR
jgi:MFS family permease